VLVRQSVQVDGVCCFCGRSVDEAEALSLAVTAAQATMVPGPTQGLWCHAGCLGERLSPDVPYDPTIFFE
jgi:hypothetical protein